jgi:4-amino-4-deoxy-L-arabinose transferase-like glycosyltransferase
MWACFHRIDRGMLIDDESAFGITTDLMLSTGDYIVPYLGDRHPHLNATPLYNWLCCLTADCFADNGARYRVWSGVFAILCALATMLLGKELFHAEVGFLAGLLMLTNHYFMFAHGARNGVMEPGTALFLVLMTYCYLRTAQPEANVRAWWLLTGAALGGAVMMKPPAMGGFYFIMICMHHLLLRREVPLLARFTRPILALSVAGLIALPWYGAVFNRVGMLALRQLFLDNSVGRVLSVEGYSPPPWWVYLDFLRNSALAGEVIWPSLAVGLLCSLLGWCRQRWLLPSFLTGSYILVISLSSVKNPHYSYCAFPFLCILTAAVFLIGFLPRPSILGNGWAAVWGWRLLAVVGTIAAVLIVRSDYRTVRHTFRLPQWEYPPLVLHRVVESEVLAGQAHFVLYQYPRFPNADRLNSKQGFGTIDGFYIPRLTHAERVKKLEGIERVLADGKPTLVVLPPRYPLNELASIWFATHPDRIIRLRTERFYYTVLVYHGAEAHFNLTDYFRLNEVPYPEHDRF